MYHNGIRVTHHIIRLIKVTCYLDDRNNNFPDVNKYTEISPLYKSKDNVSKENYRAVNILSVLSEVFERIMVNQLHNHVSHMYSKLLSAFRKGYRCEHVLHVTEQWKNGLDNDKVIGIVLMDLSKASDSVPHFLLIANLNAYDVGMKACKFIASYLSCQRQQVKYFGAKSEWVINNKGIVQGSLLGPELWNVFINDLLLMMLYNVVN